MKGNNKRQYYPWTGKTLVMILWILFLFLLLLCFFKACNDCRHLRIVTITDETGYLPDDENWDIIPDTVAPYDENDEGDLPDKVSLEQYFPPIGDQGSYGTCVAWAVGYNLNTALHAIKNRWSKEDIASPKNQTSPKDLWLGIPSRNKGAYCSGTIFEPVFTQLINVGAADLQEVPYDNLGLCQGQCIGDSTNRISNFAHVVSSSGKPTIAQLKAYLNDTIPLAISAHLGDNFMAWDDGSVLSQDTRLQFDMQHAYHAMVLVGYDDAKQAFRIRNSWGKNWGDEGSIWVDYNYFITDFCEEVFVAFL